MLRIVLTGLLLAGLVASGPVGGAPARAAAGAVARVLVQREDRESIDPVPVRVAASDADGSPVPFTGRVTLRLGRTTSAVPVSGNGEAVVELPTSGLGGGLATLVATVRGTSGRAVTVRRTRFVELLPTLDVAGFGCTAIGRAGGTIRFAVTRMAGEEIRTPNSRSVPLLPYIAPSGRRSLMVDAGGRPLRTSGRLVVLRGTRPVATVRLGAQVRRLVFGAAWNGRVGGRFAPGAYRARLTLVDAAGRTTTAVTPVQVVAKGLLPCTA